MSSGYKLAKFLWLLFPTGIRLRLRSMSMFNRFVREASTTLAQHADAEQVYSEDYFRMVEQTTGQSADVIAASIVSDLNPRKVVDVGCGTGVLLECLRGRGVQVSGLEYNRIAMRMCKERLLEVRQFDLTCDPLVSLGDANVAICFEVANLIPESAADRCVELLCTAQKAIVFSAGTPGQGGAHVRNEQPHEYWIDKFGTHGFSFDSELSIKWRSHWKVAKTAPWFFNNVMVFIRAR